MRRLDGSASPKKKSALHNRAAAKVGDEHKHCWKMLRIEAEYVPKGTNLIDRATTVKENDLRIEKKVSQITR
jgi:hypothetical protein